MRILFDGYWWYDGPTSNRMVQREIISAWRRNNPKDELSIAVPGGRRTNSGDDEGIVILATRLKRQAAINAIELPWLARRGKFDCVLAHNFTPVLTPSVVFIHDVLFMDHPSWFSRLEQFYFGLMPRLARFAQVIAVSSAAEKRRILHNIDFGRPVLVTGLGISPQLIRSQASRPDTLAVDSGEFSLVVGRLNVRKNLENTIMASIFSETAKPEHPLVVVGEGSGADVMHKLKIESHIAAGSIVFAGYVTDGNLKWLYQNCAYALCLSLGEGYGLTPKEAQYFGAPVLVSDIPVFRENLHSETVVFVNPGSVDGISEALKVMPQRNGTTQGNSGVAPSVDADWDRAVDVLRHGVGTARVSSSRTGGERVG